MRPVRVATLDRFVRDEPRVAAAAYAGRTGPPASRVRLILIRHAERKPLERRRSLRREVKNELVAVVDEPIAVDRLVMPDCQIARQPGGGPGRVPIDRDRFDPVD